MSVETESGSTNKDNDKQTIIQRIRQLLVARDTSDDDDEKLRLAKRKRLAAVSFLTVVLLAYLRYVKQRKGRNKNNASLLSPLFSFLSLTPIVSSWWKGPDYKQSLQESPMSFLWNAARDGIIQQALIGSSTIFFQTKRTANGAATWNRTLLPANNESIKSGLLEALALGGCKDIRALPESIWSKLATPVVAALPFVYLAILYRMMKNQFGGEDIFSRLKNGTRKLLEDNEMDRTTFADVAGLDSVVEDVSEVVSYLANPSIYRGLGARPPRGVLLYGPPGSGSKFVWDRNNEEKLDIIQRSTPFAYFYLFSLCLRTILKKHYLPELLPVKLVATPLRPAVARTSSKCTWAVEHREYGLCLTKYDEMP